MLYILFIYEYMLYMHVINDYMLYIPFIYEYMLYMHVINDYMLYIHFIYEYMLYINTYGVFFFGCVSDKKIHHWMPA